MTLNIKLSFRVFRSGKLNNGADSVFSEHHRIISYSRKTWSFFFFQVLIKKIIISLRYSRVKQKNKAYIITNESSLVCWNFPFFFFFFHEYILLYALIFHLVARSLITTDIFFFFFLRTTRKDKINFVSLNLEQK